MPTQSENMIFMYAGETLPIEVEVFGAGGLPLSGISVAKFALKQGATVTTKDAAITGSVVSVELSQADTILMSGIYQYEFRIKDGSGDVDSIVRGLIQVDSAIISVAI